MHTAHEAAKPRPDSLSPEPGTAAAPDRSRFASRFCTRDQSAQAEATARPIFLLQVRRYQVLELPEGYECDDEGNIFHEDDPLEEREPMPIREVAEHHFPTSMGTFPCAAESWETTRVFLTRQEAERWAKARHYRWPDGWRVYCVTCEGELAAAIEDGTEIPGNRTVLPHASGGEVTP